MTQLTKTRIDDSDAYDLSRFVAAQDAIYLQVLAELATGKKRSHWMWFVFPQFRGLGFSSTSQHYAIKSLEEAHAYLTHPVLGARLRECMQTLLRLEKRTAHDIFGSPDDLKLQSCATLFDVIEPNSLFAQVLQRYYNGEPDAKTLQLLTA